MKLTQQHLEAFFEYFKEMNEKINDPNSLETEEIKKDLDIAFNSIERSVISKGEKILDYGEVQKKIPVLIDGVFISKYQYPVFNSKNDSKEFVSEIYFQSASKSKTVPPLLINHESFFYGKKSSESIQAVEKSKIYTLDKEKLEIFFDKNFDLRKKRLNIETDSYMNLIHRTRDLQSLNNKDKIQKFYNDHPDLRGNILKEHISSYLGMVHSTFYANENK